MPVKTLLCGFAVGAMMTAGAVAQETGMEKSGYADFLDKYVVEEASGVTTVRYGAVSDKDHAALKEYIDDQSAMDPAAMSRDDAFAYWVNLYNAVTLDVVLDNYPVESIRDIRFGLGIRPGPWKEELVTVNGEAMSLDDIEHGMLREEWDEPRVHFAINCASIGCPALLPEPFSGETLDEQLDAGATAFINTDRAVQIENGKLTVSSIFKWFGEDFGENDAEIIDYLQGYAEDDLKRQLDGFSKIHGYEYDWSLNEAG